VHLAMITRIILMICMLTLITTPAAFSISDSSPKVIQGELDLRDSTWYSEQNGTISLNGEWEFFWKRLLIPGEVDYTKPSGIRGYIQVPEIWGTQSIDGYALSNSGYGTYRLLIKLPPDVVGKAQALMMPSVATAYQLWINDELMAFNGTVGTSLEEMKAHNYPKPVYFTPLKNEVEIVLQVSNFVQRKGGLWEGIEMGPAKQITFDKEKDIMLQAAVAGSLFMMGLYHIGLFAFRRSERSTLFFGIACLLICVRTLFVGNILWYRFWPEFNWELAVKLEYLSAFMGIGFFMLYTFHLHSEDMSRKVTYGLFSFICLICLPITVFPARIYTHAMLYYQMVVLSSLFYMMYVVLKAAIRKREGAWINYVAMLIFIITVINDILYYNFIINTGDLLGVGLVTFIFAQTLVLASRFSSAFLQVAKLSDQLSDANRSLENKVKERTKELEVVNVFLQESIMIDGLTNIKNRRFYDETITQLWKDAGNDHTPISLIMADIDYFKFFNDCYGHQAGDKCLKQVAQKFQKTINSKGFVARYGGEEFAIILPKITLEEARAIGESLRLSIESLKIPNEKSEVSDYITVSVGVSSITPHSSEGMDDFINTADNALYLSKSSGRNRVRYEIPKKVGPPMRGMGAT
jgi:diguanylate cyclase (GGDEF)-like protein